MPVVNAYTNLVFKHRVLLTRGKRRVLKHSSHEKRCINYTYFLGHVTCGKVSAGSEFQFTNMEFPFMYSMKLIQENNI